MKDPIKHRFSAPVNKIGINPYVFLPPAVLKALFGSAGRSKGALPVLVTLGGQVFRQNLVKYQGDWRLYLNTPMRTAAGLEVGDVASIAIAYDPAPAVLVPHPRLVAALKRHPDANGVFKQLAPSLQKEIIRYIHQLKTDEAIERNVAKAIGFLLGKERFIGRTLPAPDR